MSQYRVVMSLGCALALAVAAVPLPAQSRDTATARPTAGTAAQLQRRGLTQGEVIERLRASGMTREQVRAELRRRGYDPSLADPYYDLLERERSGRGTRTRADFEETLQQIGQSGDTTRRAIGSADSLALDVYDAEGDELEWLFGLSDADRLRPGEVAVFGRSFFQRAGGQVDVPAYGPVDASYRLGPGDEVNVVLTGAVQDAYALRIDREGVLVVPEAGQVPANGLTLSGLEDLLRARFSNVYSGVGTGANALTRVGVSLGRVRMNQIYVIGDVERPGAYQLSALGTVLSALYRAGGPSQTGSFREIEIRRGNTLLRRFDLYDYLLHGNSQADLKLENGDVVFVPAVARRVQIDGAVKRPAQYELLAMDSLRDAIRFAGGPEAEAALRRVQIDRIVPPSERKPGVERVLVDVDVVKLFSPLQPDVALADGDQVRVFSVTEERRNIVTIVGEVRRPGSYAWSAGTTLSDVLDRASGVTEAAYTERAHVFRLDPSTGARRLVSAGLQSAVPLEDRDSVVIYSRENLRTREYVTVSGLVKKPGRYLLPEGATVNDMILAAGGFAEGAYQREAYVARPNLTMERADTTARIWRVPLGGAAPGNGDGAAHPVSNAAPSWNTGSGEFTLRHGDRIEIRQAPGYEQARTVTITGEVTLPGTYVLETRDDRLGGLIAAAGGLTPQANVDGVMVTRNKDVVTTQESGARSAAEMLLQAGDSVHVPRFDPTVLVTGAVAFRTRVAYREGMSLNEYVREAGGFTRVADRGKITVVQPNGRRESVRTRVLLPDSKPEPSPGATIVVPEKPPGVTEGINWATIMSQLIAAASATATIIIALNNR